MSKRRINVRAIIMRDNKILAVKHKEADGSETEYWAIPGGGLDPLESLQDGVRREVHEELGIHIEEVGKLLFTQQYRTRRENFDEELEFFFSIAHTDAFDEIDLAKTTHGLEEIARVEFVDPRMVFILPKFLSELDLAQYVNEEKTPYIFTDLAER